MPPKPNRNHLPAVTRVVVAGAGFVDMIPTSRSKPDEPVVIVVVNLDNTEYQFRMTNFQDGGSNTPVNESDLFKTVSASHQIAASDATLVKRTVKSAGNWGPGHFAYTTYECTFELWDRNGTRMLDSIDPDYDITP